MNRGVKFFALLFCLVSLSCAQSLKDAKIEFIEDYLEYLTKEHNGKVINVTFSPSGSHFHKIIERFNHKSYVNSEVTKLDESYQYHEAWNSLEDQFDKTGMQFLSSQFDQNEIEVNDIKDVPDGIDISNDTLTDKKTRTNRISLSYPIMSIDKKAVFIAKSTYEGLIYAICFKVNGKWTSRTLETATF